MNFDGLLIIIIISDTRWEKMRKLNLLKEGRRVVVERKGRKFCLIKYIGVKKTLKDVKFPIIGFWTPPFIKNVQVV